MKAVTSHPEDGAQIINAGGCASQQTLSVDETALSEDDSTWDFRVREKSMPGFKEQAESHDGLKHLMALSWKPMFISSPKPLRP